MIPNLSIVVIGRNVAGPLKQIHASRNLLGQAREVVYVDSASTDESVALASGLGWRTIQLSGEGILSPAAGRNVGALEAAGDFILFLDADMELLQAEKLPGLVGWLEQHPYAAGICGTTTDQFPDGTTRQRNARHREFEEAHFFGGMVLLRKAALLAAGNWNPAVLANEELELHARLKRLGRQVVFHPALQCRHHTSSQNLLAALRSVYLPLSERERLFFGSYGMAVRAAWAAGSLPQLLQLASEPLLSLLGGLGAIAALLCRQYVAAGIVVCAMVLLILRRRSILYLSACPGLALQLLVGMFRYRAKQPLRKP